MQSRVRGGGDFACVRLKKVATDVPSSIAAFGTGSPPGGGTGFRYRPDRCTPPPPGQEESTVADNPEA